MEGILQSVVEWVVVALLAAVVAFVRAWVTQQIAVSKHKDLMVFVEAAVKAAEQTLTSNPAKLDQAMQQVITYAEQRGMKLDESQLRTLIEAAVHGLKEVPQNTGSEVTAPHSPTPLKKYGLANTR